MPTHHQASGALIGDGSKISVGKQSLRYIGRARSFLGGFRALSTMNAEQVDAALFLASWALELTLKAFLAEKGKGKKELEGIRHNLAALWRKAAELGLQIPAVPPHWCELLSATHDSPFHQRYPKDHCASIGPNLIQVLRELDELLDHVERSI